MKVLFFSYGPLDAYHFATQLELAIDHIEKGDEVYIIPCRGEFKSCHINPKNNKFNCFRCRQIFKNGLKLANLNNVKILNMPEVNIDLQTLPDEFNNVEELKNYTYKGQNLGLTVASSLIFDIYDHRPDMKKNKKTVYNLLYTAVLCYESSKAAIKSLSPELVYLFNGRYAEWGPALIATEEQGIKYFSHETGSSLDKYALYENSNAHDIECMKKQVFALWENAPENKEEIASDFFKKKKNKISAGDRVYTKHQTKGLLPENFDKNKKNIVIFNSSVEEYAAVRGFENLVYEDETEGVGQLAKEFLQDKNYHFYLRVHPNLSNKKNSQLQDIQKLDSLNLKNLTVIWPKEIIDTYSLIDNSDKIITFGSTVGIEATYWGKPSIIAAQRYYTSLNVAYVANNHKELVTLIKSDLEPKPPDNALKCAYWQYQKGYKRKYYKPLGFSGGKFKGKWLKTNYFKIINFYIKLFTDWFDVRVLRSKV